MTTNTLHAPAPLRTPTVVVRRARPESAADDTPLDWLLERLPAAARLLDVGTDDRLGRAYACRHPGSRWLHATFDTLPVAAADGTAFDLIVLRDDLLQRVNDPLALLRALAALAGAQTALYAGIANTAQWTTLQRLVETDLSAESSGAWGRDSLRHFSPASTYKLMMDAGWMPNLADAQCAEPDHPAVAEAAFAIADAAGVPRATAQRTLGMQRLLVEARRVFGPAPAEAPAGRFCVVVPTTRDNQLRLNVESSPGLHEVDARIVACRDAESPAHALEAALAHCDADWVLLCHQDIYFPSGFGARLGALLADIPAAERDRTLIGFAGMGVNAQSNGFVPSGFVIDRLSRFDHPVSAQAVSLDELAIVVSRNSIHRIDAEIGWHLWATELCLASICTHQVFPRIVRLPLFHNSLNDYRLPDAFHRSAQYLAAKYPAFGPIHTLCGVIEPIADAATRSIAAPGGASAEVPEGLAVQLDGVGTAIDAAMQAGDFDLALRHMVAGVHQHYRLPEAGHKVLYYPALDRRIGQLAKHLRALGPVPGRKGRPRGHLLIATELYALGGHTRVLEGMSHELGESTVLLTDLFKTYEQDPKQFDWVATQFKHTDIVVLPQGSYWEKCVMLRRYVAALNPQSIVHLAHHQDPIPYVATLGSAAPNQVFIHHADHNPSLGCTLPGLRHIDLSEGVRDLCTTHLAETPDWLPLYVEDHGMKAFPAVNGTDLSVASSGHPAKFARSGPIALEAIVRATLTAVSGCHYHIGPLDADWVAAIRASLRTQGIDPERFVHLGWVPSVWQCLKGLDAAFYVASAPLGGGRVAIEAQGCGYPVLYFENHEHTALPANHPLYASRDLAWSAPQQLGGVLAAASSRHAALSGAARALYDANFSRAQFRAALRRILPA